ncbi:MAG TPA: hypothetical protein VGL55_00390 [Steroidobacteraceae bacterium]|jgi:hypothetical protein
MQRTVLFVLLGAGTIHTCAVAADGEDPCATFSWNVSHERALFSGAPESLKAGVDPASAPLLRADRLYSLSLSPQEQVHFPVALARKKPASDPSFAGIAHLRVAKAGLYRLSLDEPFWVDIANGSELLSMGDHQGRRGCKAPHKILQFSLPGATELTLEVLGAYGPLAKITITRTPDAMP